MEINGLNAGVDAWQENEFSGPCPVRDVLDRIGDKWSVLVILRLGRKPERFRQLLRAVDGISQRMLTVTLRGLERDGLVHREVLGTRPPSVQYSLTDLGGSLLVHITALTYWALEHEPEVSAARELFEEGQT
jgi:DNA-binding HxlR family transcriptional regulator